MSPTRNFIFLVHTKPGITKFRSTSEGLYYFKPPISYLENLTETKIMIPSIYVIGMELSHTISDVK